MAFLTRRSMGCAIVLAVAVPVAPVSAEANPEQGKAKSIQCVTCHGAEGETTNPTFPNLAGQNASYLSIQLQHFKSGERYHPIMSPIAEALSEQDIADLAAYYSQLVNENKAER